MITLTRIRQNTPFILNPDLIERVDTHVDTVVRLTSGTEYVVNETGDEIVRRTAEFRARVLALAGTLDVSSSAVSAPVPSPPAAAPPDVWAPADSTAGEPDAAIESSDEEAAL
jgi:flagellar protein FlbD